MKKLQEAPDQINYIKTSVLAQSFAFSSEHPEGSSKTRCPRLVGFITGLCKEVSELCAHCFRAVIEGKEKYHWLV